MHGLTIIYRFVARSLADDGCEIISAYHYTKYLLMPAQCIDHSTILLGFMTNILQPPEPRLRIAKPYLDQSFFSYSGIFRQKLECCLLLATASPLARTPYLYFGVDHDFSILVSKESYPSVILFCGRDCPSSRDYSTHDNICTQPPISHQLPYLQLCEILTCASVAVITL